MLERISFVTLEHTVLVGLSIAVKRHPDHSNSYKGKHLIGCLIVSVDKSITIMARHGDNTDRHGAGEEAESCTSDPRATGSELCHWV